MRLHRVLIGTASALALALAPLGAQDPAPPSHPWAAFFGCWSPIDGARTLGVTCVVPVEGEAFEAEQITIVGSSVVGSIRLRADGTRRDVSANGCNGWEVAAFSDDATRVYTRGTATCAGTEQHTSGIYSITPEGHFLQVAAVRVGEQRTMSTQRYGILSAENLPEVIRPRLRPLTVMANGARTLAARPLDVDAVQEGLQAVDGHVVEAWMAETGVGTTGLRLTKRDLQRLVAINAPTRVIDMAVVLANPQQFEPRITRVASSGGGGGSMLGSPFLNDPRFSGFCDQLSWGLNGFQGGFASWAPLLYPAMGMSYYAWFPDCVGRGFYSRMAFGPWGYGSWYGVPFGGTPTPITVTVTPRTPSRPGTVTKGSGYGRSGEEPSPTGSTAQPRGGPGTGTVRAAGASASSTGASDGGVRSAGSGGTGRTAKPRDP